MDAEQLSKLAEECEAQVRVKLKENLVASITQSVQYEVQKQVAEKVSEWAKQNLIPEVGKYLTENKAGIIAAACTGAAGVGDELAKAIVANATKRLSESWTRSSILKEIFGN